MKIAVVSGTIANKLRHGGAVWTRLNWILGLRKLGFDVYFVEQISRNACVDTKGAPTAFQESENLNYFETVTQEYGLDGKAALIYEAGESTYGMSLDELTNLAADCEVLVNITGNLTLPGLKSKARCKVYVDLDPGFTQLWQSTGDLGSSFLDHDHYFTIGENIGHSTCSIPTNGIAWKTVRQPVVLEEWPVVHSDTPHRFTTIAAWRGTYGALSSDGRRLGLKAHEFRKLLPLPERVEACFELALNIDKEDWRDRQQLESHGWKVVDPESRVPDPSSFRRYVQESGAECSVAKEIYVETNSGWFSDRTVRYLATGTPAVVQDTGFSSRYPVGEGLFCFKTLEEAAAGAKRILADYPSHCVAARKIAEQFFDSGRVLSKFCEQVGVIP